MKRILYLTNIEVPYRVRFFNELAKYCDLTVVYERRRSKNRDAAWSSSESGRFRTEYLDGIHIHNESSFSLRILKYITGRYDAIIVGCYNSPVQAMAILVMRLLRIKYIVNVDGEVFVSGSDIKSKLKCLFLKGAAVYMAAGEKAAESLRAIADSAPVFPYYFSSLSKEELLLHRQEHSNTHRNDTVLVVGQYFDYKGMDVALSAAKMDSGIRYKLVGMGKRTELFKEHYRTEDIPNVELIPFLQKEKLEQEYKKCAMLVLPSRQECWGLVINEAASFGVPIVSTWGSGAAVEFLADAYPQYLAKPNDPEDLLRCIRALKSSENKAVYCEYLLNKAALYSIEHSVQKHLAACGIRV